MLRGLLGRQAVGIDRLIAGGALLGFAAGLAACAPVRVLPVPPPRSDVVAAPVSRADAIADIDTLVRILEDVHPNLYAVRSRDSVAAERERIVAHLPDFESRLDLWKQLAPLVAHLGDGHTAIFLPKEEIARLHGDRALLFPAAFTVDDANRLVVSAAFAGDVRSGETLASINAHDADSLVRAWSEEVSGESDRFRASEVASNFRVLALIHGITTPFTATFVSAGGTRRTVTVPGLSEDSIADVVRRRRAARAQPAGPQSVSYRSPAPRIGYLDVRGFDGDPEVFARRMNEAFAHVASDADTTLIIDLRTNGGGDSRLVEELLRHVTTTAYRLNAREDWKMSAQYRAHLREAIAPPLRWVHAWNLSSQGRAMFGGPDGSIVSMPEEPASRGRREPFFSGALCLLVGPGTFSSASDLADAVKTYHLGTLIGEETGGRVNTFGEGYQFRLPRSQLLVQVSSAFFVRASGDTADHRGVVPDVRVPASSEPLRDRRDAVLETAVRECGRRGS